MGVFCCLFFMNGMIRLFIVNKPCLSKKEMFSANHLIYFTPSLANQNAQKTIDKRRKLYLIRYENKNRVTGLLLWRKTADAAYIPFLDNFLHFQVAEKFFSKIFLSLSFPNYYCKQEISCAIVDAISHFFRIRPSFQRNAEWAFSIHISRIDFNFAYIFLAYLSFKFLFCLTLYVLLVNLHPRLPFVLCATKFQCSHFSSCAIP